MNTSAYLRAQPALCGRSALTAAGSALVTCLNGQPAIPAATCAGLLTSALTISPSTGLSAGQTARNAFLVNQFENNGEGPMRLLIVSCLTDAEYAMRDGKLGKLDPMSPVTRKVAEMAHLGGISVEGELGVPGSLEAYRSAKSSTASGTACARSTSTPTTASR